MRLYFVVIPAPVTLGATDNMLQIGSTLISTWLSASLLAQVETIKLRNYIRRVINQPNDMIRLCLIRPPDDLTQQFGVSLLSFGRRVPELVGAGEQAANDRLNLFDPDPGQETTWY